VFLKNEGRVEALFTLYFLGLLVQALIERELRRAMTRNRMAELPLYPEERLSKRPTTEPVLRLFSLAERHVLVLRGTTVQVFPIVFTDFQRESLALLGIPEGGLPAASVGRRAAPLSSPRCAECTPRKAGGRAEVRNGTRQRMNAGPPRPKSRPELAAASRGS
jgi:hypothetical protein